LEVIQKMIAKCNRKENCEAVVIGNCGFRSWMSYTVRPGISKMIDLPPRGLEG
ncbi:1514_t:CDS:1, partial [Cetraspora pellucida]